MPGTFPYYSKFMPKAYCTCSSLRLTCTHVRHTHVGVH